MLRYVLYKITLDLTFEKFHQHVMKMLAANEFLSPGPGGRYDRLVSFLGGVYGFV